MKKIVVLVLAMLCMVISIAIAMPSYEDNSNTNEQGQLQGQIQGQMQNQLQGQAQGQGQIAVGETAQDVSISGDETKVKSYAVSYPALSGGEGISQANAYSIFGGLGLSQTEKYKVYIVQIQAIEASTVLTAEQKVAYINTLATKMMKTNKTQRWLGFGPETSGRNLFNLFGILSWDSVWAESQKPFQSKKDIK